MAFRQSNFQQFIAQLSQGDSVDASLANVYGFDIDGLDARWAGEAPGARAPAPAAPSAAPGNPSPILFFNSWLLGGLVLLVLAAVSIQYVATKLRPDPYPEEGLQPWKDPALWDDDDSDRSGPY